MRPRSVSQSTLRHRRHRTKPRSKSLSITAASPSALLSVLSGYLDMLRTFAPISELDTADETDESDSDFYSEEIRSHVTQSLERMRQYVPLPEDISDDLPLQTLVSRLESVQVRLFDEAYRSHLAALREYLTEEASKLSHLMHDNLSSLRSGASEQLHSFRSGASEQFSSLKTGATTQLSSFKTGASSQLSSLKTGASEQLSSLKTGASEQLLSLKTQASEQMEQISDIYHRSLEIGRRRLLRYDELPLEWRNNQYILSGYRYYSIQNWPRLLYSAFEWHNETVNIHSHLLGFFSLFTLFYHQTQDRFISTLFILAAMKCLLCSCAWHLLSGCADSAWYRGAACVDYVGISGLIAASVMGAEYYGFYCRPNIAQLYMGISATMGFAGMGLSWSDRFNRSRPMRISFFVGLAASSVLPLTHMAYLFGLPSTISFFLPVVPSVLSYVVGLLFYAHHFPECAKPGTCDHLFASHQLWHVSIVAAIWMHWAALTQWARVTTQLHLNPSCQA